LPQADESVRRRLLEEAESVGWQRMHERLAAVDPIAAERIHPNDPQRIQRALEVHVVTGRPMSELQQEREETSLPYHIIKFVLAPHSREVLRERIALRFHLMLEQGFEQEVRELLEKYTLSPDMPSMRSVGYRQMLHFIQGEWNHDEMVSKGITATRQLAKRQMTWLRSEKNAIWLQQNGENAGQILERMLN
jgi:tRNA dimethylallyltransferase